MLQPMGNVKRGKGRPFAPGVSGNPGGRAKLTDQDRLVQKLSRETWNDLSEKMMTCSTDELQQMLGGKLPTEMEMFIRHVLDLCEKPDWHAYERYLARRIGPIKQELDVTVKQRRQVLTSPSGEKIILESKLEQEEK